MLACLPEIAVGSQAQLCMGELTVRVFQLCLDRGRRRPEWADGIAIGHSFDQVLLTDCAALSLRIGESSRPLASGIERYAQGFRGQGGLALHVCHRTQVPQARGLVCTETPCEVFLVQEMSGIKLSSRVFQ